MKFSIKNIRKLQEEIKKEQQEIEEIQKLTKKLSILSDHFRSLEQDEKIAYFKDGAIISVSCDRKLLAASVIAAYLKTDLLVTKNFIMKKLLTKKLNLVNKRIKLYQSCISVANEFLRRSGWDVDMS